MTPPPLVVRQSHDTVHVTAITQWVVSGLLMQVMLAIEVTA